MEHSTLSLAKTLIEKPSVSPDDAGCLPIICKKLEEVGFDTKLLDFENVKNLWATHGSEGPTLCLVGHTDVVPTGPQNNWIHPPFEPTIIGDALYGRGACDMKGALAAMIVAACQYAKDFPEHKGRLAFLITSDEEGKALHGTRAVVEWLQQQNEHIEYALVGEPSSKQRLGDVVKIGRRGSLNGELTIKGKQGHVAYPHLAENPIHNAFEVLNPLLDIKWDTGHPDFPETSLVFSNIQSGTGANNVIPGDLSAKFNFRYNPAVNHDHLIKAFEAKLSESNIDFEIDWQHSGLPFITEHESPLIKSTVKAIKDQLEIEPELSTTGGTSDGRFIALMGTDVVEFGPINETIHQVNEWVSVQHLIEITKVYYEIIKDVFNQAN